MTQPEENDAHRVDIDAWSQIDLPDAIDATPPVMERLKEATDDLHDALEALSFNERLMGGELSPTEYGHWLRALLAIHEPLEAQIRSRSDDRLAAVWSEQRARAEYLVDDLEQLGCSLETPDDDRGVRALHAAHTTVEDVSNWETCDLLGALYVVEGSTLGGMYIAEQLREQSERLEAATSFYTAHGRETRPMWEAFGEAMNDVVRDPEDIRDCMSAARRLFAGIGEVLEILSL